MPAVAAIESLPAASLFRWAGFGAMCLGMFMAILDIQVVVTSLPVIEDALAIGKERMSWIQTSYLIAEIIAIPLTGLLTRLLSMRWLFVAATGLFTIASIGCAVSWGFGTLIAARAVQGFGGGALIPLVFAAVFHLFSKREEALATTIAGMLAVLAPTLGPLVGGWITENLSWHWLFLVNVPPGIAAAMIGAACLPRTAPIAAALRNLDWLSLISLAIALGAIEIALKEAPVRGWISAVIIGALATSALGSLIFIRRTLTSPSPIVNLGLLRNRQFAAGAIMSFALGAALFGSVYLMPVFLAFVREHGPFEIGTIMLVTGITQLAIAPFAVQMEKRADARLVAGLGFALLAIGLALSAFQTIETDFRQMFWPQIVRGAAIMLCLLAPTRLALGSLPLASVDDGSSLFNLMRNLGGAVGIALVDTVIFTRTAQYGESLLVQLQAGNSEAARITGLSLSGNDFHDPMQLMAMMGDIERASLTLAVNEAWGMLAILTLVAMTALFFAGPRRA